MTRASMLHVSSSFIEFPSDSIVSSIFLYVYIYIYTYICRSLLAAPSTSDFSRPDANLTDKALNASRFGNCLLWLWG